jgi:glycerophosphoryl diester phosphodiesterase
MSDPLQSLARPRIIAHRGASAIAPENTAASFREALRLGAKIIECDVRATRDGDLVVFHDETLDRLARRPGRIADCDREMISSLEVGGWFGDGSFAGEPVLWFEAALRICREGGAILLIEHKTGDPGAYAAVIRETAMETRVIVQSFDWAFLRAFRTLMPEIPVGAIGDGALDEERIRQLAELAPDWIGWHAGDLKESDVSVVKGIGARFALWTVNDPAIATTWLKRGADAIITDVPDVIAGVVKGSVEAE